MCASVMYMHSFIVVANAMATRALEYVNLNTLVHMCAKLDELCRAKSANEEFEKECRQVDSLKDCLVLHRLPNSTKF